MSAVQTRMERAHAIEIAKAFVAEIEPHTDRLVVAGSLRRRLALIGDIEIVAVPKVETVAIPVTDLFGEKIEHADVDRLDERLGQMLTVGAVSKRLDTNGSPRWGSRLKYLLYQDARVDLFCPSAEQFGWHLLIRTGPAIFSRQLVVEKGKRTKDGRPGLLPPSLKPIDGWICERTSGYRIPTPDEKSVFELFKLPYREPWRRE
jgi:DNA polymerase/3'-5' exonuclease PolX